MYRVVMTPNQDILIHAGAVHIDSGASAVFDGQGLLLDKPGQWMLRMQYPQGCCVYIIKLAENGDVEMPPTVYVGVEQV